jgi:hypothetical protein
VESVYNAVRTDSLYKADYVSSLKSLYINLKKSYLIFFGLTLHKLFFPSRNDMKTGLVLLHTADHKMCTTEGWTMNETDRDCYIPETGNTSIWSVAYVREIRI